MGLLLLVFRCDHDMTIPPVDLRTLGPQNLLEIDLEIETFGVHLEMTWTKA